MTAIRILFAEDDRLVLATMSSGLRQAGFDVTTAESGEQALELARTGEFDLALLDIRLPGMNGCETARLLLKDRGLPSLFLTAYDDQALVQEAVAVGGLGYVLKPVDVIQLVPTLLTAAARAADLKALSETRLQLERALTRRRQTSIAIGILMERGGLTEQGAFEALRTRARSSRRKMEDVCGELTKAAERRNSL